MQGAFAEHARALEAGGVVRAVEVRTAEQLDAVEGIVIPGGESTAIRKALDRARLLEPLRARVGDGLPALGTCAGLIVLADTDPDGAPACFGVLDVRVDRNGYGRQVHSFEADVREPDGTSHHGVFIRAPRIARIGDEVEVLASYGDEPVAVRQGNIFAATFHPELTDDHWLHEAFAQAVVAGSD
jgi:5'-phosphate synthase pdxT subunit